MFKWSKILFKMDVDELFGTLKKTFASVQLCKNVKRRKKMKRERVNHLDVNILFLLYEFVKRVQS